MCPPLIWVWSPRAATMLRSVKEAVVMLRPGTRFRISPRVIPPNLRSSSLVTTSITPGASARFSENLEAVVTFMLRSDSRSRE